MSDNNADSARRSLVHLLRLAYSGELAAVLAYEGHLMAVFDKQEKRDIRKIQNDEVEHRNRVKYILNQLGERPSLIREIVMWCIGSTVGLVCLLTKYFPMSWFFAMYGAGKLEANNILEYSHAAEFAVRAGMPHLVPDLMGMSNTEREHEEYFYQKVISHCMSRHVLVWRL
ncbi:MAG: demethoxyubiquinone hydroxylase family protein [Candidatus Vogelbacteria bacterium]|nr:demethoxyubiquinone hydroxylase family protein [Candidatus Vogelbacteria bacterium]